MTSIDFNNFINFLNDNRIFPSSLINDPVWQKNSQIFLSTFERFMKTKQGEKYLDYLQSSTIVITTGVIIPDCEKCGDRI